MRLPSTRCHIRASLILSAVGILLAVPANAQWEPTSGPGRAGINVLHSQGNLFAGSTGQGVFRSTNNGTSWLPGNIGLEAARVSALASTATHLFAGLEGDGIDGGVYRSSNGGASWQPARNGLGVVSIPALLAVGNALYAGTFGSGVFKSTNAGDSWFPANNGMETELIQAIVRNGTTLFAAGSNFLYRSDNDGASWEFTNGGQFFQIASMFSVGSNIYCGGFQGLIRSTDGGASFSERIDIPFIGSVDRLTSFASSGGVIFASTSSSPGSGGSGVLRSSDGGLTWTPSNTGIEISGIQSLLISGTRFIAGSIDKSIVISDNAGMTWTESVTGLPPGGNVREFVTLGSQLFAGAQGDGVHRSTDSGTSWTRSSSDPTGFLRNATVLSLATMNNLVFAGTSQHGLFRSSNQGTSWLRIGDFPPDAFQILDLAPIGANLLAATSAGLFWSSDSGDHWFEAGIPQGTVTALVGGNGNVGCANLVTGFFPSDGIYRTTNGGISWTFVLQTIFSSEVASMAFGDNTFYAGNFLAGMIRSTDGGLTWEGTAGNFPVFGIAALPTDLFVSSRAEDGQLFRSTNHGDSWELWNQGLPSTQAMEALGATTQFVVAGTENLGAFRRLRPGTSAVAEADAPAALHLDLASVNPSHGSTSLHYYLPDPMEVDLRVFDVSGRTVAVLESGLLASGDHHATWNAHGAPAGVYFARLAAGTSRTEARIVLSP